MEIDQIPLHCVGKYCRFCVIRIAYARSKHHTGLSQNRSINSQIRQICVRISLSDTERHWMARCETKVNKLILSPLPFENQTCLISPRAESLCHLVKSRRRENPAESSNSRKIIYVRE